MNNYAAFALLYLLSCVPWAIACLTTANKDVLWGLFIIDGVLTFASYVFLWHEIGWFTVLVVLAMGGIGKIMEGLGMADGYKPLFASERKKNAEGKL